MKPASSTACAHSSLLVQYTEASAASGGVCGRGWESICLLVSRGLALWHCDLALCCAVLHQGCLWLHVHARPPGKPGSCRVDHYRAYSLAVCAVWPSGRPLMALLCCGHCHLLDMHWMTACGCPLWLPPPQALLLGASVNLDRRAALHPCLGRAFALPAWSSELVCGRKLDGQSSGFPLQAFAALAESDELRLDLELQPGDIQLLNNMEMLHSRSAFRDHVVRVTARRAHSGSPVWGQYRQTESGWPACRGLAVLRCCSSCCSTGRHHF